MNCYATESDPTMSDDQRPACSNMHCKEAATNAVQVSLPHGMGHALCCDQHGPRDGERHGVVGVDHYLKFTRTAAKGSSDAHG